MAVNKGTAAAVTVPQRFAEDGTLTSLRRAWFDGLSQCGDVGASQLDNSRLGITQLLGVFVFLAIGVVLAFATGTVENLRWCLKRRYPEVGPCGSHGIC